MQIFYNKTFNSCIVKTDSVKLSLKTMAGFPRQENCSSHEGKFCDKNKKVTSISQAALKTLEIYQNGDIRMQIVTHFDDERISCTLAEMSITKI